MALNLPSGATFKVDKNAFWFGFSTSCWNACWSYTADSDTWTKFDNVSIDATDLIFSHNTALPIKVYIAFNPMYPFSRTRRLVTEWSSNILVSETVSTTNKIISYAPAATDSGGRTIAALPYFAFKVANATANTKNKAIMTARLHSCEGAGAFEFEGAINWLLTTTPEQKFLLDWFTFFVYPNLMPRNTMAGHSRAEWDDFTQESNGQWDTTGLNPRVDAFKTAMTADTGGSVDVGLDYHAYYSSGTTMGDVQDDTEAMHLKWKAEMLTYDPTYSFLKEILPYVTTAFWRDSLAAKIYLHSEQKMGLTRGIPEWKVFGENTMKTLTNMVAKGQFSNGPTLGSRSTIGASDKIAWPSIFNPGNNPMTIAMWVKLSAVNVNQIFFEIHGTNGYGMYLWNPGVIVGSGRLEFNRDSIAGQFMDKCSNSAVLTIGQWTHLTVTWDGIFTSSSGVHLFVNGSEIPAAGFDGTGVAKATDGAWNMCDPTGPNWQIRGSGAQIAFWDRVLDNASIAKLGKTAGYAPSQFPTGLRFYFPGNTGDLHDTITNNLGVATGMTQITGETNGPGIIYP